MQLPHAINRASRCRKRTLAGQILTEAVIGLALLAFVWILLSYVNYICNNRIRTNMTARYSAWLSGNSADPTANGSIAQCFFMNNDTNLAVVSPSATHTLNLCGVSLPNFISGLLDTELCSNSVSFGTNTVNSSSPFPFDMLSVNVPFMPTLLTNVTIVSSHCAWPRNVSDTYSNLISVEEGALLGYEMAAWESSIP
jgi:hypothetical protein